LPGRDVPFRKSSLSDAEAEAILQRSAEHSRKIAAARQHQTAPPKIEMPKVTIVDDDTLRRQQEAELRAQRSEAAAECFRRANVPPKYRHASLNDLSAIPEEIEGQPVLKKYTAAVAQLRRAIDHPGIYVLGGDIGPGKTHLACGLINAYCAAGRSARFISAPDYVDNVQGTYRSPVLRATEQYQTEHLRVSLLVLDEWTINKNTPDANRILLRLLIKRYEASAATVLIGNYGTIGDFEADIDARVASRICDGGGFILCDWPDLRGRLVVPAAALSPITD